MHFLQRIGEYKLYLYINISIYLHYGRSSSQNVTIAPNNLFFGTLVWLSANCDNTAFLFKTNTVWSNTKFFCNFRYAFFFLFSVFYNAFKNNFWVVAQMLHLYMSPACLQCMNGHQFQGGSLKPKGENWCFSCNVTSEKKIAKPFCLNKFEQIEWSNSKIKKKHEFFLLFLAAYRFSASTLPQFFPRFCFSWHRLDKFRFLPVAVPFFFHFCLRIIQVSFAYYSI